MRTLPSLLCWFACSAVVADDGMRLFEAEVRPILVERCVGCHGDEKQESGLRVDARDRLLIGGERGAALVPGDVAGSRLLQAVRHEGDLQMPPDEVLTAREIRALTQWVEIGAPWPADDVPTATSATSSKHWAFEPVTLPAIPGVTNPAWPRSPIDHFVLARLDAAGLSPSPEADRRTLIRRVSYTLTGLPPSPAEVQEFVTDPDPLAYERLVERWLESKHYGEHWARHWLDLARYSDTKGYVYAREERRWVHAWPYRDWIVQAFNEDLPYDRFLLLQLAADQVEDRRVDDLAAMGFLTLGRRFLGVNRDIIDDRIDVICRGTLGLTVSCARCHNHKYDPIPTADYYSLYGVLDSCAERLVSLEVAEGDSPFWQELRKRQDTLDAKLAAARAESSDRVRARLADYLRAQRELGKYPADGFDQIFQKTDLLPAFVRRWEQYLYRAERSEDPVFRPWHAYAAIAGDDFATAARNVTRRLQQAAPDRIHPVVRRTFQDPPETFEEVIERYAHIFAEVDKQWQALLQAKVAASGEPPMTLPDDADEQLRRVLYGPASPCEMPDQPIVHTETYFDSDTCTELWKLHGEVDRWILDSEAPVRFARTLVDRPIAARPRIFRRGNPLDLGAEVPRKFLTVFDRIFPEPFRQGSGRLELARAIIDPANPLTARVMVNRVWMHHFGQGLVRSASDFGLRAGEPSHPALLDWLATQFVRAGWSVKQLHRLILLSATFRQSSSPPADSSHLARVRQIDPENRLLWRHTPQRLTFESFRDSLLAVSGELDRRIGGPSSDLFAQPFPVRRTLYGKVDRQFLPGTLRTFDFANPDLHIEKRSETMVPQQALFLLNHPFVLERARALAAASRQETLTGSVRSLFQLALQRPPSDEELDDSLQFLNRLNRDQYVWSTGITKVTSDSGPTRNSPADGTVETVEQLTPWTQLAHVLICTNEFLFVD